MRGRPEKNVHKIILQLMEVGSFEVVVMQWREIWDRGEYSDWFIEIFILLAPGRYEVQASCSLSTETPLDVGHELPPDVLEAVHTEGALLAGLAGDVALAGVRAAEHGEHDVVLGRHAEVSRQVRAGLAHVGRLGGEVD